MSKFWFSRWFVASTYSDWGYWSLHITIGKRFVTFSIGKTDEP